MRQNIERKHVELNTRCPICNKYFEDGGHLFLRCTDLKKVWRAVLPDHIWVKLLDCTLSMDLLHEVLSLSYDDEAIEIACSSAWASILRASLAFDMALVPTKIGTPSWSRPIHPQPLPDSGWKDPSTLIMIQSLSGGCHFSLLGLLNWLFPEEIFPFSSVSPHHKLKLIH
jgi:hypothetical protein